MSFYVLLAKERKLFLGIFLSAPVHVSKFLVFRLILLRVGCLRQKKKKERKKERKKRKKEKEKTRDYITVFYGVLCPQLACLILAHFHSLLMFILYIISGF